VPVIVRQQDRNELRQMRWGLVPSWAQEPSMGQRMINARAEHCWKNHRSSSLWQHSAALFPLIGFTSGGGSAQAGADVDYAQEP
jgi:putative SOS response-associated peptidase YedK